MASPDYAELERKAARTALISRTAVVVAAVAGLAVVVVLAWVLVSIKTLAEQDHLRIIQNERIQRFIRTQAVENHQAAVRIERITKVLRDCTSPSGKCYKAAQAQNAAQVGAINAITNLAAACADKPGTQTVREIKVCVARILHQDKS